MLLKDSVYAGGCSAGDATAATAAPGREAAGIAAIAFVKADTIAPALQFEEAGKPVRRNSEGGEP